MSAPREPLAIDGGTPVRDVSLPYGRQAITEADIAAVVEVLRSDWLTGGPMVARFEEMFAARVGARHAVTFSSGTAALHGACAAAGLGEGDEAVTTPMTFCATANAVVYQGARPVFADVSPDTLNLDPRSLERRMTPKTRAILPVDYAGHPADIEAVLALARERKVVVIEDACHALGARFRQRPVGSISDMTVFSFHPVKHLTTGEGGMVTTDNEGFAARLRQFRSHGITTDGRARQLRGEWRYEMTTLGFNYRLPDIVCALGLSQLPRLTANVERRQAIASAYDAALGDVEGLQLPTTRPDVEHAWHLYPVRVLAGSAARDRAFQALRAEGIGVNVHYIPVHWHPYYEERFGSQRGTCPVAEAAAGQLLSLPMFHAMTDDDIADVVTAVRKVVARL